MGGSIEAYSNSHALIAARATLGMLEVLLVHPVRYIYGVPEQAQA